MNRTNRRVLVGLAVALAAPAALAEAFTCPATLLEQPTLQRVQKPWALISHAAERPLEQVGVFLGPVDELGGYVPSSNSKSKAIEKVVWDISRSATDQFWIGCSYTGTTALATQAIPETASRCTVSYDLLPTGRRLQVHSVECK